VDNTTAFQIGSAFLESSLQEKVSSIGGGGRAAVAGGTSNALAKYYPTV